MSALPYASGYAGSSNPKAIELAERLAKIMYPSINRFYFTSGRRRVHRQQHQNGALLLEAKRQTGEDEGNFARMGLSRCDASRDERDRDRQVLANVRAAGPRV